jgi:S1-C subfamily serine protease
LVALRSLSLHVAAALVAAGASAALARPEEPVTAATRNTTTTPGAEAARRLEKADTVSDLVERASRWVVAIQVDRESDLELPERAVFPGFGGRRRSPVTEAYRKRPAGYASGVLLDGGRILTSLYNVAGTLKSIRVTLHDGQSLPARLVARSEGDDIALLQVESPEGSPPPRSEPLWADASSARAGRMVLALGRSPDPGRVTATRGIISAIGRNGGRAFQTDAELNYGNTGGPIIDLDGRIVGIAAFIGHTQLQWGFNSGVGFGTTAATVEEVLPQLLAGKDVEQPPRPVLGVQKDPEVPDIEGARVHSVMEGSAAARAGILPGDVITEIEGVTLHSFDHLRRIVYSRKPGEAVKLKVRRGTEVLDVEPRLGSMRRQ